MLGRTILIAAIAVGATACRPPATRAPIPRDAVMVLVVRDGSLDEVAREMRAPVPGEHVGAERGVWMLLDVDAMTTARCPEGGECVVASSVASRKAHWEMKLRTLGEDERVDTEAWPEAAVVAWGVGEVIGAGVGVEGLGKERVMATAEVVEGELRIEIGTGTGTGTGTGPRAVKIGEYCEPPEVERLEMLPVPAKDENVDVPLSAEYVAVRDRVAHVLADAVAMAQEIEATEARARERWIEAWGEAVIEGRVVRWKVRTGARKQADRVWARERGGVEALRARYAERIGEARALIADMTRVRARDVAEYDRRR